MLPGALAGDRQFQQCEGVALCLRQHAIPVGGRECGRALGQQSRGCRCIESGQRHPGESGGGEALPGGDDQRDALGVESPRREQQGFGRGPVQPLRVIDQAHDGPAVGELGQQGQDAESDEHAIAGLGRGEPEGTAHRARLRGGQCVGPVECGAQQQMQARERQVRLGFDPGAADDPQPIGRRCRILQQCGLADARLTGEEQTSAATGPAIHQ